MRYISIPKGDIAINPNEVAERLKIPRGFQFEGIDRCMENIIGTADVRAVCVRLPVAISGSAVEIGHIKTESRDLAKNLAGCRETLVFAVTLGQGVDRLLKRLSLISAAEHFICDALASAYAECAADAADDAFSEGLSCKARFSPGYGDLSLEIQGEVLEVTGAAKHLGITLTESLLMLPTKTVTAVKGIFG